MKRYNGKNANPGLAYRKIIKILTEQQVSEKQLYLPCLHYKLQTTDNSSAERKDGRLRTQTLRITIALKAATVMVVREPKYSTNLCSSPKRTGLAFSRRAE
jgi:hypothetical protein